MQAYREQILACLLVERELLLEGARATGVVFRRCLVRLVAKGEPETEDEGRERVKDSQCDTGRTESRVSQSPGSKAAVARSANHHAALRNWTK